MSSYIQGIDLSAVQANPDFDAIKKMGYQFVILRCGVGNDGIDATFSSRVAKAQAAGLYIAIYNVIYPIPVIPGKESRSPQAQAQAHWNASHGLPMFIDVEFPAPQDWAKWGCSAGQINQWCLDYLQCYSQLSNNSINMGIYCYPDFMRHVNFSTQMSQYPLWIASYQNGAPELVKPWNDWICWQTGGGKTAALPDGEPVDADVMKDLSFFTSKTNNQNAPVNNSPNPTNNSPNPITIPEITINSSDPVPAFINANFFTAVWNWLSRLFEKK